MNRRIGRKYFGVVGIAAAMLALGVGCGKKPEAPPAPSPEEQATELLSKAKAALAEGKFDEAERIRAQAESTAAIPGVKELKEQIEAARAKALEKERQAKIQASLREAELLLDQKEYDKCLAKIDEVLALDPAHAQATELKAKAERAKELASKPGPAEEYQRISAEIDAAKEAKNWDEAIAKIRELEQFVGPDRPSRQNEVADIEASKLAAEGARIAAAAQALPELRQAREKFEQALRKADRPDIREQLQGVQKKIEALERREASERRYAEAMQRGAQLEAADDPAGALRQYTAAEAEAQQLEPRKLRAARDGIKRARDELSYRGARDAGDQALARKDYAAAIEQYRNAQSIKDTPEIRSKLQEAQGLEAEAAGKAALAEGNLEEALAKFNEAQSLRPTAELAALIEETQAKKERKDYEAEIARAKALREQKNFRSVKARLEELAAKYPKWPEASELLKQGMLPEEQKLVDEAALKVWTNLQTNLKKITEPQKKIDAITAVMPQLAMSKYETQAANMIKSERDKLLSGRFADVQKVAGTKKGKDKIAYLEGVLAQFEGSSHADKIKNMIKAEKDALAKDAYDKLTADVAKLASPQKVARLEAALPNFAGTSYEGQIKKAIQAELDAQAADRFNKLNQAVSALKSPAQKIAKYEEALPSFAGTSHEKKIKDAIMRERDTLKQEAFTKLQENVKKLATSELKLMELQRQLPDFAGTKFEAMIKKMIDSEKDAQLTARYNTVKAAIDKETDPNRKIARLEAAEAEFAKTRYEAAIKSALEKERSNLKKNLYNNVMKTAEAKKTSREKADYLRSQLPEFKGTSFQKQIEAQIKNAEAKIAAEEKQAREADAQKRFDALMEQIKKTPKDYDGNIAKLKELRQQVAGTNVVAKIDAEIKKQEAAKQEAAKQAPKK